MSLGDGKREEALTHMKRVEEYLLDKKVPRQNIVPHVRYAIAALQAAGTPT